MLQGEAMRDLIAAVKNRHVPGLPVSQEDIIAFLYVVVSPLPPRISERLRGRLWVSH